MVISSTVPSPIQALNATGMGNTVPTTRSQWNSTIWAIQLIRAINLQAGKQVVPMTTTNIQSIRSWMTAENNTPSWLTNNDPLNVSNQSGGFSFSTIQDGINATASTILQSNMTPILQSLQANSPTASFGQALASTPWDAGHYSQYVAQYGSSWLASLVPQSMWATGTGTNPTGALGQLMQSASSAASDVKVGNPISSLSSLDSSVGGLVQDISSGAWWKRIGIGAGGAILIIGGIVLYASQSPTVQKTVGTVAEAAA